MSPLLVDGKFLALAYSYQYRRPGQPLFSNAEIWTLVSDDGVRWRRDRRVNPRNPRPPELQRGCTGGAWMMNPDIARDDAGRYFLTRAYSDNYAGCDVTFPNRVQVYSARDLRALVDGPWTSIVDLGCKELGFQPDSAQILHDGVGRPVERIPGSLTLTIAVSGCARDFSLCGVSRVHRGACGAPPAQRIQEVTVVPRS
jgi:hypothetical protein